MASATMAPPDAPPTATIPFQLDDIQLEGAPDGSARLLVRLKVGMNAEAIFGLLGAIWEERVAGPLLAVEQELGSSSPYQRFRQIQAALVDSRQEREAAQRRLQDLDVRLVANIKSGDREAARAVERDKESCRADMERCETRMKLLGGQELAAARREADLLFQEEKERKKRELLATFAEELDEIGAPVEPENLVRAMGLLYCMAQFSLGGHSRHGSPTLHHQLLARNFEAIGP